MTVTPEIAPLISGCLLRCADCNVIAGRGDCLQNQLARPELARQQLSLCPQSLLHRCVLIQLSVICIFKTWDSERLHKKSLPTFFSFGCPAREQYDQPAPKASQLHQRLHRLRQPRWLWVCFCRRQQQQQQQRRPQPTDSAEGEVGAPVLRPNLGICLRNSTLVWAAQTGICPGRPQQVEFSWDQLWRDRHWCGPTLPSCGWASAAIATSSGSRSDAQFRAQ